MNEVLVEIEVKDNRSFSEIVEETQEMISEVITGLRENINRYDKLIEKENELLNEIGVLLRGVKDDETGSKG